MKTVLILLKKELGEYFNTASAYIILIIFVITINWFFLKSFFIMNIASMNYFFKLIPWFFMFLIPAITMKSFSEEKRSGTYEVLITYPINEYHIVAGKFIGAFIFMSIALLLTSELIFTVSYVGFPDFGPIIGGYAGALLLGGACISIGMCMSSISSNQVISFILSVTLILFLNLLGEPIVTYSLPGYIAPILQSLSLKYHFANISHGIIDLRDIIYYFSVITTFSFLNILFLRLGRK